MKASTQKRLGAALIIIALLITAAFYVSGTPLLLLQESRTTSSPGRAVMIVSTYKAHWSLRATSVLALTGLVVFLWPARKPPRLQP